MEITFRSHLDSNKVIATKFCTWHDSCAVVACAKVCCDLMASNGITARRSFHRIWITGKKPLVKRALDCIIIAHVRAARILLYLDSEYIKPLVKQIVVIIEIAVSYGNYAKSSRSSYVFDFKARWYIHMQCYNFRAQGYDIWKYFLLWFNVAHCNLFCTTDSRRRRDWVCAQGKTI